MSDYFKGTFNGMAVAIVALVVMRIFWGWELVQVKPLPACFAHEPIKGKGK
jgi:hypothetical protein